ncbi:alpha/beta-hydrolase [Meredithblackwellia eburnea MCA 4105]
MLDQLYGRPSSSWKRTQVFLVLLFWTTRLVKGNPKGPRLFWLRRINKYLSKFTPWQIVLSTFTIVYAVKHSDAILGLQAPEPLARLYSKNYYRATWIVTALDAGFATAMTIKPKWLRDLFSLAFSGYYLLFANEADEKLRKYRAMCTVEMLRTTWEKTSNPYVRFFTKHLRPRLGINRKVLLPRPKGSTYSKPITAYLYFDGTEDELALQTDLIFDIPGGGFICMNPEHHEERTLRWAKRTGRPVIGFDYGKAPEYPYPFAIDEMFDAYKLLYESNGKFIGMSGTRLNVVITGDSAGANIGTAMMVKILETRPRLASPVALVWAYAALSFHFTSWMPASDLHVLRQESHSNVAGLLRGKDHLEHKSPLSVVEDVERPKMRRRRTSSWGLTLARSSAALSASGYEGEDEVEEKDKSLSERVVFWNADGGQRQKELQEQADQAGKVVAAKIAEGPLETRLAMTSRSAFFNDRIISPAMCRAMALLYIGPRNAPDLHSDYHISPIFTPPSLLCQFPPVYLSCGERDPFVDDTVIFAGKIREAKETRKLELLARENKFGESLRMSAGASGNGPKRESIQDEDEEDWVQMKIIEGWSHGYMQMLSLLPEAEHSINMNADWIIDAFEKNEAKHPTITRALTAPPIASSLSAPSKTSSGSTTPANGRPSLNSNGSSGGKLLPPSTLGATSEDDDMLSFTPRKRSIGSRSDSPAPSVGGTSPPMTNSSSTLASTSTRGGRSSSSASTGTVPPQLVKKVGGGGSSSSDDAISESMPRTPPEASSPPPSSLAHPDSLAPSTTGAGTVPTLHIISPHERALRDELSQTPLFQKQSGGKATHAVGGNLDGGAKLTRQTSLPVEHRRRRTVGGGEGEPRGHSVFSDEDGDYSEEGDDGKPGGRLLPAGATAKTSRSGSAGSLAHKDGAHQTPSNFVDAKDLLRRRREEAIFGMNSATNSAQVSDEEE